MRNKRSLEAIATDAKKAYESEGLEAAAEFLFEGIEEWARREDARHRAFEADQREKRVANQGGRRDPHITALMGSLSSRPGVRATN